MSTTEAGNASRDAAAGQAGMHLEIQVIPVSDVEASKEFYTRLGWRFDDDVAPLDGLLLAASLPLQ